MGVKDFTKVFEPLREFTYKEFNGKNVVIDASVEIYRSALGMKISETLTDKYGNPTAHINILLLGVILKLKASGASQYWIFDHRQKKGPNDEFHNPLKQLELQKRKEKRNVANAKLFELKKSLNQLTLEEELFSEIDESEDDNSIKVIKDKVAKDKVVKDKVAKNIIKENIDKQEKVAFTLKPFYTEDVIFMLDMLEIPWMECPAGFDAEQIAAFSTNNKNIFNKKMDYVLTPDADTLLFGAKKLIKKDIRKKKLFLYDLQDLLDKNDLTQDELIKVGLILGTDFAKKSPGVGPKTVLKKFRDLTLSSEQIDAMNSNFKRKLTINELDKIIINNKECAPFTTDKKYVQLLDWLELVKNFNRARIIKQFIKNKLFIDIA